MARRQIALVTRELYPFMGGGIAPIVAATATVLAEVADVTIFTTASHRERYEELSAAGPVYAPGVEVVFVEEPNPLGYGEFSSYMHAWSTRLFEALSEHCAGGGPDLIEFPDYLAEGFVTVQARRMGEPFLRDTLVVVRTHTSSELTSILNGALRNDAETHAVFEKERYCLREADHVVHPGGDVLDTYRRFYGDGGLAPARRLHEAFQTDFRPVAAELAPHPEAGEAEPLRMLFLGRLERRKGVQDLTRALERTGYQNFRLTFLGADTPTAPLATSMRVQLEMAVGDDERFVFLDPVPRSEVGHTIAAHDLVVVPSKWECWPNVVREAFLHNRPVVGTPVGGIVEMVEDGVSGWLASEPSPAALLRVLEGLFEHPERVREMIAAGGPRAAYERLVDPERTRRDYLELMEGPRGGRRRRAPAARATVSVIVPYYQMHEHVEETIESVMAQTVRPDEVVVVLDGSFRPVDQVVEELAERHDLRLVGQPNTGLSATRNLGVSLARGRYVLPLDPDNTLEPEFLERTLYALEHDEALAYATTWSRYMDEDGRLLDDGYAPLGNWSRLVDRNNVAGDGTALLRRRLFDLGFGYNPDLTSYEDWFLYRQLHHAGHHGDVVPRRLFRYRVRTDSMLRVTGLQHTAQIYDEMNALMAESEVRWKPLNV